MVAQHTICFYWLVPGPLIKHRVGDTFIPDKPISRQGVVLYNSDVNLACAPQLSHLCVPGPGHRWALPFQGVGGGSWDVHHRINWILNVTLQCYWSWWMKHSERSTHKHTLTHTQPHTQKSIEPYASVTSSRLVYGSNVSSKLECFVVWNICQRSVIAEV